MYSHHFAPHTIFGPTIQAFVELRERLRQACPDFESWWESHEVMQRFRLAEGAATILGGA